jgi:predicted RNase H-like HicB family nuclease
MVARKFTVVLEPAEEGGFIVKCLELPVATQGETRMEALRNIKEAIEVIWRLRQSFYVAKPREKGLRWLSKLPLL